MEENKMSNGKECGCEYLKTDPREVAKFTDKTRVEEIIRKIPLLFKENIFAKVVQLAVLLPPKREIEEILESNMAVFNLDMSGIKKEHAKNLYDTMIAIEASHSLLIRNKPYEQKVDVIEDLAKLSLLTKEGEYWEKELLNALLEDEELNKSIGVWIKNLDSIKKLMELFHISDDKIREICRRAINESKNSKPSICIEMAKKMLIALNLSEYKEIADLLMMAANKDEVRRSRRETVEKACAVYKALQQYGTFDREEILKEFKKDNIQGAIKKASVILRFKYNSRWLK